MPDQASNAVKTLDFVLVDPSQSTAGETEGPLTYMDIHVLRSRSDSFLDRVLAEKRRKREPEFAI